MIYYVYLVLGSEFGTVMFSGLPALFHDCIEDTSEYWCVFSTGLTVLNSNLFRKKFTGGTSGNALPFFASCAGSTTTMMLPTNL